MMGPGKRPEALALARLKGGLGRKRVLSVVVGVGTFNVIEEFVHCALAYGLLRMVLAGRLIAQYSR